MPIVLLEVVSRWKDKLRTVEERKDGVNKGYVHALSFTDFDLYQQHTCYRLAVK